MIKRTSFEWAKLVGVEIIDPDGWRKDDNVWLETPIGYFDFCNRMEVSTIRPLWKGAPEPLSASRIWSVVIP